MTCDEFESFLHPYLDGEFEARERLELETHLAGCSPCADRLHAEVRFRGAFRQRMRDISEERTSAPASLRLAIQGSLRQEVAVQRRRQRWQLGAAAAVLLTAGGTVWMLRPDPMRPYVDDAARRHARGLPFEIEQSSPEHVEAWFTGKLDHRVAVPRFENLAVSGARIANVKDRPAAYITYQAEHAGASPRRVGLFVFSDTEGAVAANTFPSVDVDTSHGYNVALWRDGEVVYELVSDLDEADIRRLVASGSLPGRSPRPAPVEVRTVANPLDVVPVSTPLEVRPVSTPFEVRSVSTSEQLSR